MSKLLMSVLAIAVLAGQSIAQESQRIATVEVIGSKQLLTRDESQQDALEFWLQQLMLSALYRDVVQDSSVNEWEQQLSAPTRIHCHYSSSATLAIPERKSLSFDEVPVPLPSEQYPDYVFIKRGQQVQRLAKYDPWVLRKLLSEAGLPVYESLSDVERALF